jgi:hypothetical protein
MPNDNLRKLNNYFKKYIDGMLIKDIELLKDRNDELKFSYPYLLLASSCIDFFGGIENGFTNPNGLGNSRDRFEWFITEWMGKINSLYKERSLAHLIYCNWRCGIVHQATLKKGFETSSFMYPKKKHLNYIEDKERVFIHSIQFADDLIKAQKLYREYINNSATDTSYIESLYAHLLEMLGENKSHGETALSALKQLLQNDNFVFYSTDFIPTTSTTTTSSRSPSQKTTMPISAEFDPSTVSAAAEEGDL